MERHIRIPAIAAAAAFSLSALVGILSRIPFGTLCLRALVFAAASGLFAFGALKLFDLYLPELGEPGPEPERKESGGKVDIVIQDEDEPQGVEGELPSAEPSADEDGESLTATEGEDSVLARIEREAEDAGSVSLLEDEEGPPPSRAQVARPPDHFDDLDVLPDLDGMSDSFETPDAVEESPSTGPAPVAVRARPSKGGDAWGGADAETLAKAVRTILKKDQKG